MLAELYKVLRGLRDFWKPSGAESPTIGQQRRVLQAASWAERVAQLAMCVARPAMIRICFSKRADGHGSRTLQQCLARGRRGEIASAREYCECMLECFAPGP